MQTIDLKIIAESALRQIASDSKLTPAERAAILREIKIKIEQYLTGFDLMGFKQEASLPWYKGLSRER